MVFCKPQLFVAVMAIVFTSCSSSSGKVAIKDTAHELAVKEEERITEVKIVVVNKKTFTAIIRSNGKVRSLKEQRFVSQGGGEVVVSKASNGAWCNAGTILLKMETVPIELKIDRAMLALFNSQKEYESLLLGYESLLKGKDSAQAETIKKKLRISTGMLTAEQDIKQAKYELLKSYIKAPFNGILSDVKIQQGQLVKYGDELFKMYDPNQLTVDIKILESDAGLIKKGMVAIIAPVSSPDKTYKAEVFEINPYVDDNGLLDVKLKINLFASAEESKVLFPGMNCTATLHAPLKKALIVPKEAIVMRSGSPVVFSIEEGLAKWNYVVTGKDNGVEVEIKEGLHAGASVITTNNLQLSHDSPVKQATDSTGKNKNNFSQP
jgi:membrane fusion protein (multidrug efflux system)